MKITGPINYVKLEGKINNSYKTIEVFFDIHLPFKDQTSFNNNNNTLLDYLNQFNQIFDIYIENFVEHKKTILEKKPNDIHINKLRKELIDNTTHRIHPIDIRNIISNGNVHGIFTLLKNYFTIADKSKTNINEFLTKVLDLSIVCRQSFQQLYELLYHKKVDSPMTKYVAKFTKVNSIIVKDYLKNQLTELHTYFKKCFILLDKLAKYLENNKNINANDLDLYEHNGKFNYFMFTKNSIYSEILNKVSSYIEKLYAVNKFINIKLMDLYLLRKVLDNRSNVNNVIYCGADHCINYIMVLVKKFDFIVKTCYYSEYDNIVNINKAIKFGEFQDVKKLFFPKKLIQSIDI